MKLSRILVAVAAVVTVFTASYATGSGHHAAHRASASEGCPSVGTIDGGGC